MLNRLFPPMTLASQLTMIALLLTLSGLSGMSLTDWLARGIQGSAHAVNVAGSLRMQSYRMLADVPLKSSDRGLLEEMDRTLSSTHLGSIARHDGQATQLRALKTHWYKTLRPGLTRATSQRQMSREVALFVNQIDKLVSAIDSATERRIARVAALQQGLAGVMGLILLFTLIWLRRRLLHPWRQLLRMAGTVGQRDFSHRISLRGRDEMATLSQAFNSMSTELAIGYAALEQRVNEKTAGLALKNETLHFLYRASRDLHHSTMPVEERIAPIFHELERLTGLQGVTLRIDDIDAKGCDRESTSDRLEQFPVRDLSQNILIWRLKDNRHQYGLVLARLSEEASLSQEQQQVIETLMELVTATLVQVQQTARRQQLLVMEERATIARELHDSIAQSLSCIKMQVSCLQMQSGSTLSPESQALLNGIRSQLNVAWHQLRELLTNFRLKLNESGLRPALESSCAEYTLKMGFPVILDYQLSSGAVPSHQAIHVVQIVREALNNSYLHAACQSAGVTVSHSGEAVRVLIWDNGCGFDGQSRNNHYGIVIMRDRVRYLGGTIEFCRRSGGGTRVVVDFKPSLAITGETYERSTGNDNTTD